MAAGHFNKRHVKAGKAQIKTILHGFKSAASVSPLFLMTTQMP